MKKLMIGLMLVPALSHAEFLSGNELLSRMDSGNHGLEMMALGYVAGVADVGHGVTHCATTTVTIGQVRDMTRELLKAIPDKRHMSADSFVTATLKAAFPCKQSSGRVQNL